MSVQQPTGDLTSPSTYMNNSNTGLLTPSPPGHDSAQHPDQLQQQQHPHVLSSKQEDLAGSNQYLNTVMSGHQQHQGQGLDSMLQPGGGAAAAAADFGGSSMTPTGGHLHDPDSLHPGADALGSHPLMLTTADSLLSQGSTDLCGLGPGFDVEGLQQQQHHAGGYGAGAGASRISIEMQDVLNSDAGVPHVHSPQLHAGSHSPGLSHFGGSGGHTSGLPHGADSYTADSMKGHQHHHHQQQQQQNGTHYGALVPQEVHQQQQHMPAVQQQRQQQQQQQYSRQAQSQQRQHHGASSSRAGSSAAAAAAAAGGGGEGPPQPVFRSQYRGVSYDKKKRKWRVQIKVAALGKSGVSVGYFDTEDAAARAYDRAAIGLLGRQNCKAVLNFPIEEYDNDSVPELVGKSREEVKATLKSERAKLPRRRLTHRRRTSRFLGVGSSNRKNQWQARILYHGKVTHLGYYRTEEEAARVYDKVSISLHGAGAQTNFPIDQYKHEVGSLQQKLSGLTREELQRALGVKPMDKSSRYRGVSKKKGRWEAKVMLNRKWAYREMFDTETEAARAYDAALWRLKPREARNYANFKDTCPPDVAEVLAALEKDTPLALHPTGLPLTAKPLIDAGLLYDDEGLSIRAPNGLTRSVSIGDLISGGDSANQSLSEEPSAGNASADRPPVSGDGASGGVVGAVAGQAEGISSMAGSAAAAAAAAGMGGVGGMVKSASYSALSGLDGAVTSSLAAAPETDPAAAAAAPVPLSSLPASARSALRGELTHVHLQQLPGQQFGSQQQQHHMGGGGFGGHSRSLGGMTRVQSVPQLRSYGSDAGSPTLAPMPGGGMLHAGGGAGAYGSSGPVAGGSYGGAYEQQQWMQQHQGQQQVSAFAQGSMAIKAESAYWTPELSYPLPDHTSFHHQQQQQGQQHHGMRASRSCGNLAFMTSGSSSLAMSGMQGMGPGMLHGSHAAPSPPDNLHQQHFGSSSGSGGAADAGGFAGESKPLMVRVGSEQHLLNPIPNPQAGFKGMTRIASEGHLSSMVPMSPRHQFLGPEGGLIDGPVQQMGAHDAAGYGSSSGYSMQQQQQQHVMQGAAYGAAAGYAASSGAAYGVGMQQYGVMPGSQQGMQQGMYGMAAGQQPGTGYMAASSTGGYGQQQTGMQQLQPGTLHVSMGAPGGAGMPPLSPVRQQQQQQLAPAATSGAAAPGGTGVRQLRASSSGSMHRAHSCAALESIDETAVFRLQTFKSEEGPAQLGARGHSMPGTLPAGAMGPSGGAPASASAAYMAAQQQQQAGMAPGSSALPAISTALPAPHSHHQQQFGQQAAMHGGFGGPSASAVLMGQAGGNGGSSSGGMYGSAAGSQPGATAAGSAAAAAAAFDAMSAGEDKWGMLGQAPDSPLGMVQIGGEELDVTMAFLADHSPRHLNEPDGGLLDIGGLLSDPAHVPASTAPPAATHKMDEC